MLSNLKSLCPKKSLIAMALAVGMGSMCVTNYAYAAGNQAKAYAFSHQSVEDVKAVLSDSKLYMLLLAFRTKVPEIETAAYHAMALSLLHQIAANTSKVQASSNSLVSMHHLSVSAGEGAFDVPDPELNGIRSVTPDEIKRYVNHVSCELSRLK